MFSRCVEGVLKRDPIFFKNEESRGGCTVDTCNGGIGPLE